MQKIVIIQSSNFYQNQSIFWPFFLPKTKTSSVPCLYFGLNFFFYDQITQMKTYLWVPNEYTYNAAILFCYFGPFLQPLSDYSWITLVTLFPFPVSRKIIGKNQLIRHSKWRRFHNPNHFLVHLLNLKVNGDFKLGHCITLRCASCPQF